MSRSDAMAPPRDYLKTYSLTCEPFANTLDGRFFYAGPALMQRLDLLTHLTQFGESVILVSGPQGSGKTTLLGHFVAQSGRQWRLCLINADEFVQFRQRFGDALGIGDNSDEVSMLQQWASSHDASQLAVIVIDNTQLLQPDALNTLCHLLDQPQGDRVRVIMFGTPQAQEAIKQTLERWDPPCNTQLLEIPKLSEEETAAYLMYRLAVAGYSGESPFTATEVRAICKAGEGRPAAISQLAHDALLEHQMRSRSKRLRVRRPGWLARPSTWAMASVGVVALAVYLGWERLQPELPGAEEPPAIPSHEIPLEIPSTPKANAPAPNGTSAPQETMQGAAAAGETQTADAAAPAEPQDADPVPAPQRLQTAPTDSGPQQTVAPLPAETPATAPAATATPVQAEAETASRGVQPTATPSTSRPPETLAPPASAPPAAEADQPGQTAAAGTGRPATASSPDKKPAPQEDSHSEAPHREAWLLKQPPDHYSLQLLGSRQEDSMLAYIRDNGLDPVRCAYYRGTFKGGDWFVLMYGNFPDRDAALAARGALPAQVQKEKPWPRSLASVHNAIQEAQ